MSTGNCHMAARGVSLRMCKWSISPWQYTETETIGTRSTPTFVSLSSSRRPNQTGRRSTRSRSLAEQARQVPLAHHALRVLLAFPMLIPFARSLSRTLIGVIDSPQRAIAARSRASIPSRKPGLTQTCNGRGSGWTNQIPHTRG
jgi:hypothetical protein